MTRKRHYVNLTLEEFMKINKEYTQYMQEKFKKMENFKQQKEEVKKIAEKEFINLVKQSDVKFETKNPKASVVSFVDPYCPHCKHMKEILLEKSRKGKSMLISYPFLYQLSLKK